MAADYTIMIPHCQLVSTVVLSVPGKMTLSEKSSGRNSQVVAESAWTKAQIINASAAKTCQAGCFY